MFSRKGVGYANKLQPRKAHTATQVCVEQLCQLMGRELQMWFDESRGLFLLMPRVAQSSRKLL